MSGHPIIIWTEEEDRAIVEGTQAGMTSGQLGKLLGRPASTIRNRVMKWRNNGWQRPSSLFDTAITPEEDKKILAMSAAGMLQREIAEKIGRSRSAVSSRLAILHNKTRAELQSSKRELVRCLGGCGKMFQSENRCTNRICNRCKQRHQEYSGGMAENFSIRL